MKRLLIAIALMIPLLAIGAYRENPFTTNYPAAMSNAFNLIGATQGFTTNTQATVSFGTVGATTVNATTVGATTVNATTVGATTVNGTTVNSTTVGATTVNTTTINSTNSITGTSSANTVNTTTINSTNSITGTSSANTVNTTTINSTNSITGTNSANQVKVSDTIFGTNFYGSDMRLSQTLVVSNMYLLYPQWVDIPMNYGFSVTGPNAPSLTVVSPTSPVQGLAFDNNDILYAQGQWQHSVADTNALYPQFVIHPHVHFSTVGAGLPDATHSNVTWKIEWEWASLNQFFTNAWSTGTNSVTFGVATNYMHYLAGLGPITNVVPPGISAIFRCRLTRPASGLRDYSNAHDVILDSLDVHIPVGNSRVLGSRTDAAP
jgi:hypothetical protein